MGIITKLKQFIAAHKVISLVAVVLLASGGYFAYRATTAATTVSKYVLAAAERSTIVSSVSGSGQVAPGTSVDVKPQVSETVTKVLIKVGDHVSAGQVVVQLDGTNEAKAVKQAQLNLQSAQLSLAKLQKAPSTSTLSGAQDAVTQAEESQVQASTTLEKDYQSGFDTLGTSFVDFQNVMLGMQDFVGGNEINRVQSNPDAYVNIMPNYLQSSALPYRNDVQSRFTAAVTAYKADLLAYHAANRNSDAGTLDALFSQTYTTGKTMSDAVKSAKDFLNYVINNYPNSSTTNPLPAATNMFVSNLSAYTNTIGGDVSQLGNVENLVMTDKNSIRDSALTLNEKQSALADLTAGPDSLDLQSQQISIESQAMNLQDAEDKLADTSVRAPIAGVISAIAAIPGETAASSVVSIVGNGELAQITLNEVDAAKVSAGQKATLTFDAIDGLSLAGVVAEIDPVGTVTQGVVNYNVKISFDDPGNQVKPGMSVTADIATNVKSDVVAVPNSAVTTQGGVSFVLEPSDVVSESDVTASVSGGILLAVPPKRVPVTAGVSNDTLTEIISGVNPGDLVITRTITAGGGTGAAAPAGGTNALRIGGGLFGGGGAGTGGRVPGGATGR